MRCFCGDITHVQAFVNQAGFRKSAGDVMLSINSIHVRFASGAAGYLLSHKGDTHYGLGGWCYNSNLKYIKKDRFPISYFYGIIVYTIVLPWYGVIYDMADINLLNGGNFFDANYIPICVMIAEHNQHMYYHIHSLFEFVCTI